MTFEEMLPWVVGANAVMTFGQTAYMLLSTRATKALKDIDALIARLDRDASDRKITDAAIVARIHVAETNLQKIEADIKHMPDRDHAKRTELALEKLAGALATLDARLSGRMDAFRAELQPVAAIAERMQDLLMEGARK